ncbi:MAG TPA: MFS transporter [Acidimicrobiia bacterium]|jgi:MFS family permease
MTLVTKVSAETSRRSVWADPDFRRLWRASTISLFGTNVGELALPLLAILTLAASPLQLGLLRGAQFLPFLLMTLPLGVLVDRAAKRPLMVLSDLGRFLLVGAIPVLIWAGVREIGIVLVLVFLSGCLTVLYQLADFAILPTLVTEELIVDANGKLSASASANEIAGGGAGGVIVQLLTAPVAVFVDAVTYLLSAMSLRRITARDTIGIASRNGSAMSDALEGLSAAVRSRFIRPLIGEAATFNFFNEFFVIGLLLVATRDLGLGPAVIGAVFVAGGIGSFAGAWFGARVTRRFGYGRVLLVTMLVGNGAPLGVVLIRGGRTAALMVLVTVFILMGVGIGIANVHAVSLRQTAVADEMRSRVNAGYRLFTWGALPLGAVVGGAVAAGSGARTAMLVGAAGIALATSWVAFSAIPRLESIRGAREDSTTDLAAGDLPGRDGGAGSVG